MKCLRSGILVAAACLGLGGCAEPLGRWVVKAPNHGRAADGLAAHHADPVVPGTTITTRLRTVVPGSAVSLSVWVLDPSDERAVEAGGTLRFEPAPGAAPATPRGTVLMLHGFRHPKNNRAYLVWGRYLASLGYRAVLVDLRGHGGSSGDWVTFGPGEAADLVALVDGLERRGLVAGRLGVMGASLGGATALQLAGRDPRVAAVVTVSAFASLREVLGPFARAELGFLHGLVGVWGYDRIVDAAGRAGGFDPGQTDVRAPIRCTRAAVLLTHSSNDRHVPVAQAHALGRAGGLRSRLWVTPGPGHFEMGDQDAAELREQVRAWFDRHLASAVPAPGG